MMTRAIMSSAASACTSPTIDDGDSKRCGAEGIRIANIGAPKLLGSPKCAARRRASAWCGNRAGTTAKDVLRAFLALMPVVLQRSGVDRYERALATISVDGRNAGAYLVSLGLARRWR